MRSGECSYHRCASRLSAHPGLTYRTVDQAVLCHPSPSSSPDGSCHPCPAGSAGSGRVGWWTDSRPRPSPRLECSYVHRCLSRVQLCRMRQLNASRYGWAVKPGGAGQGVAARSPARGDEVHVLSESQRRERFRDCVCLASYACCGVSGGAWWETTGCRTRGVVSGGESHGSASGGVVGLPGTVTP